MNPFICTYCNGKGSRTNTSSSSVSCGSCQGSGTQKKIIAGGIIVCPKCQGSGFKTATSYGNTSCIHCNGIGNFSKSHALCPDCTNGCNSCNFRRIIRVVDGEISTRCPDCTGKKEFKIYHSCEDCDGTGLNKYRRKGESVICQKCKGNCKWTELKPCVRCYSTGKIKVEV